MSYKLVFLTEVGFVVAETSTTLHYMVELKKSRYDNPRHTELHRYTDSVELWIFVQ